LDLRVINGTDKKLHARYLYDVMTMMDYKKKKKLFILEVTIRISAVNRKGLYEEFCVAWMVMK